MIISLRMKIQKLARADADIELRDLAEDSAENDDGSYLRDQQQRPPARIGDMLQAPGHAHEAQLIKGHESQIEADDPAPEAGVAEAFIQGESEPAMIDDMIPKKALTLAPAPMVKK